MKRLTYNHTLLACHGAGISQAIINNFTPLILVMLQRTYDLPLAQITLLITLNFLTQLATDILTARYADRIGYRTCMVGAHMLCAVGLVGLGILPELLSPFVGLLIAVMLYAVGGGLIEVLNTPIADACPTDNHAASMSFLHSSYCWGTVMTVAVSTLLFTLMGMESWKLVGAFWALFPLTVAVLFSAVPFAPLIPEGERGMSLKELLQQRMFWVLLLLMVCAGASEQAMSQWASAFAESGLQVSKTVGDLAGACFFSVLMGSARVLFSKVAGKVELERCMSASAVLCIASYVLAVLPLHPLLNLLGCGLCGFSVGVFWPGTFSVGTQRCPLGGTVMFAMLALAGDLGCSAGPTLVGFVSGMFGDNLKSGLAAAVVFPVLIIAGMRLLKQCRVHQ